MLAEEGVAELCVAEGFGAAWAECGERSGDVAYGRGTERVVTVEVGVEEAGVEAVAGADGVCGIDEERGDPVALVAALDDCAAGAALDDDQWDARGEGVEGLF